MIAVLPHTSAERPLPAVSPPVAAVPPDGSPGAELLTITTQPIPPHATVIIVRGEVDLYTGPLLQDALLAHLRHTSLPLVIDLTHVEFLGAAGLTVLVIARETAVAAGVGLCLVAHSRPVLLPLTITGLDRVFAIHPHLADALPRIGDGSARQHAG